MLVKVETYFDGEFWCARGMGEDIFTQAGTLDELHQNIKEAVAAHYGDTDEPITEIYPCFCSTLDTPHQPHPEL